YNYKTLWLIPGIFLTAPLQNVMLDSQTGPTVAHIQAALPDRESFVLTSSASHDGLNTEWRLSRLDDRGDIDASFAQQKRTLPDLDFIRPDRNGSALINWRDYSTNKIATLGLDGTITPLFDLTPTSELVTADAISDGAIDALGRVLLAGAFEKKPPSGVPGYADVNYPLARFN